MRSRWTFAAVIAAALIVALFVWRRGAAPGARPSTSTGVATVSATRAVAPGAATTTGEPATEPPPARTRLAPAARQRLLAQLREARARRAPSTAATTPASAPPALAAPTLEKAYVQSRVRELVPLIAECYERALEDTPTLEGKVVVEFTLGGEPEIGGLVESSEVLAEESTIAHPAMVECMRETMYGIEFDPPAGGGQVVVRYPFTFHAAAN